MLDRPGSSPRSKLKKSRNRCGAAVPLLNVLHFCTCLYHNRICIRRWLCHTTGRKIPPLAPRHYPLSRNHAIDTRWVTTPSTYTMSYVPEKTISKFIVEHASYIVTARRATRHRELVSSGQTIWCIARLLAAGCLNVHIQHIQSAAHPPYSTSILPRALWREHGQSQTQHAHTTSQRPALLDMTRAIVFGFFNSNRGNTRRSDELLSLKRAKYNTYTRKTQHIHTHSLSLTSRTLI